MWLMKSVLCLSALVWSGGQVVAAPGDTIGSAVSIINVVTAQYASDERRLATGDGVRQDEFIEVETDGRGELLLRDQTKLALGPGSRLMLDEFVYNPDVSGGAIVLNLVRGAFRFVTGVAAKPAYVIRTPTASITVRGTIFDVHVPTVGPTWLLLIEGAIEVCNDRGECRVHDEPGKLIRVTSGGDVGNPVKWASLPEREDAKFDSAFPFVVKAPLFDPTPLFTRDEIVLGTFPTDPDQPDSDEANADDDNNNQATTPTRKKKKVIKRRAKSKKKPRRRRASSDDAKKIIQGVTIGIGIGRAIGGGRGDRGGRGNNHNNGKYK